MSKDKFLLEIEGTRLEALRSFLHQEDPSAGVEACLEVILIDYLRLNSNHVKVTNLSPDFDLHPGEVQEVLDKYAGGNMSALGDECEECLDLYEDILVLISEVKRLSPKETP